MDGWVDGWMDLGSSFLLVESFQPYQHIIQIALRTYIHIYIYTYIIIYNYIYIWPELSPIEGHRLCHPSVRNSITHLQVTLLKVEASCLYEFMVLLDPHAVEASATL